MCNDVIFRVDVGRWVEVLRVVVFSQRCLRKSVRVGVCESFAPTDARAEIVEVSPEPAVALAADGPAQ